MAESGTLSLNHGPRGMLTAQSRRSPLPLQSEECVCSVGETHIQPIKSAVHLLLELRQTGSCNHSELKDSQGLLHFKRPLQLYSRFLWVNEPFTFPLPAPWGDKVLLFQLQFACYIREFVTSHQSCGPPLAKHLGLVLIL